MRCLRKRAQRADLLGMNRAEIQITGEPSSDPMVCRFHVSEQIYKGNKFHCTDAEAARGSALLEALCGVKLGRGVG